MANVNEINNEENITPKMGSWSYESPSKPKRRGNHHDELNFEIEDERLRQDHEIEDFIQNIPDIDELQEEELVAQVAAPPSAVVHQVTTYKQLDNDLVKHASLFTMDGEIDLKLLAKVMSPESEIQEEDKPWEWDKLFAEMSRDLEDTWKQEHSGSSDIVPASHSNTSSSTLPTPRTI